MDFKEGLQIHKKLFPKATFSGQLNHLIEELKEYENAETVAEKYQELGDVLVCIVSLFRYEDKKILGKFLLRHFFYNHDPDERKKRLKYYERALEKCKKRVSENRYELVNGNYVRNKVDIYV